MRSARKLSSGRLDETSRDELSDRRFGDTDEATDVDEPDAAFVDEAAREPRLDVQPYRDLIEGEQTLSAVDRHRGINTFRVIELDGDEHPISGRVTVHYQRT